MEPMGQHIETCVSMVHCASDGRRPQEADRHSAFRPVMFFFCFSMSYQLLLTSRCVACGSAMYSLVLDFRLVISA